MRPYLHVAEVFGCEWSYLPPAQFRYVKRPRFRVAVRSRKQFGRFGDDNLLDVQLQVFAGEMTPV